MKEILQAKGAFDYKNNVPLGYDPNELKVKEPKQLPNGAQYLGEWNKETKMREGKGI